MAVTNQQIIDYLLANPNLSDAQIVAAMEQNGISPSQMASAVGIPEGQIISRVAAVVPEGQSVTLGDTRIAPQYQVIGSGEDRQVGGVEAIYVDKTTGDANYKAPVGSEYQVLSPDGTYQSTGTIKKDQSFFGGLVDAFKDPVVLAALGGTALAQGALGSSLFGTPEGLTLNELLPGANNLAAATNVADVVGATEGGLLSGAPTGLSLAELSGTAGGTLTPAATAATTGLLSNIPASVTDVASKIATGVGTGLLTKAVADNIGNVVSGATGLAGGVLQSKESREAAQKAAADIAKATQTAQEAAQFRPVGMTTRFGTSNYTYDPVTGRMTSAGYQLSPEAKAAQDRLVGLAGRGLTQAEQAQAQFAPLQTGAQGLFGLGNQYISQSPQDVAQNYINQQMALLRPGRELELANLQNRLQQQGRAGLSVAQGGTLGATTPELQALYNARAQQELQLAAQAQQAGQQNVLFGAGLLGQGAQALGNYYGGQTAAYQPYTTALGQIQNLETAAQQPLQMGANLAQQASAAGARSGALGVQGAIGTGNILTSPAVTTNPYAAFLSGAASPTSTFGQGISNWLTGYNPTADQNAVVNPYFTPTTSVWGS